MARIVRKGEVDNTLADPTDTDPNRYDGHRDDDAGHVPSADPAVSSGDYGGGEPPSSDPASLSLPIPTDIPVIEGTDGNPLKGMPGEGSGKQMTEIPTVAVAVDVTDAPAMAPKRRGKVQDGADNMMGTPSASLSMPVSTSESLSPSKNLALEARKSIRPGERVGGAAPRRERKNLFQSMMLGAVEDKDDAVSVGGRSNLGQMMDANDMSRSLRRGSAVTQAPMGGVGGVIAALPQDDGAAMLIPASMEAPDQIFMPNLKREPFVPVRLARDKIKQALSEIADHNSKHYAAIDTMEKQYEILKAQLEHQVATYVKKLTHHYNERVANLDKLLKDRLTAGAKAQAFAQLFEDVEKWKKRALDAEEELDDVKKELEQARKDLASGSAAVSPSASRQRYGQDEDDDV